jgi:hypothetical protein
MTGLGQGVGNFAKELIMAPSHGWGKKQHFQPFSFLLLHILGTDLLMENEENQENRKKVQKSSLFHDLGKIL